MNNSPAYLVLYTIGATRMAATINSNREIIEEVDPGREEIQQLADGGNEIGPVDSAIWDDTFGHLSTTERENAQAYELA